MMKCNVDLNHALNISFSLSDAKGARPKGVSTWRFNFLFDPHKDFFAQEYLEQMYSRDRLQTHESQGIRCEDFGELLLGTGLVLTEENSYIAFSCESGLSEPSRPRGQGNRPFCEPPERRFHGLYCFSYLLRILMSQELPNDVRSFYEALDMFFPRRCDLADNLQLLHHLCQHDQGDPLRRPYFCNAQACLDGFFRLPEAIRKQSFDRTKPQIEAPAAGRASRRHRRRSKGEKEEEKGTNGTLVNGHGAEARNGLAAPEPSWQ
ncbi:unnamed protein product [Effrenium voratum]|nr:unnamed protein product [Effrenium voratum]CAJ1431157.1 unnamed protein product [Effrenium voratum]